MYLFKKDDIVVYRSYPTMQPLKVVRDQENAESMVFVVNEKSEFPIKFSVISTNLRLQNEHKKPEFKSKLPTRLLNELKGK